MIHKVETELTTEFFANKHASDDYVFREMALEMIKLLPISDLKKLVKFTKTDPTSIEFRDKLNDVRTSEYERDRLRMLERRQMIHCVVEIDL